MSSTDRSLDTSGHSSADAHQLSFDFNSVDPKSGKILSRRAKEDLRRKLGYCTTCPGVPVLLYTTRKGRLSSFSAKQPRTAPGECREGVCLKCNPDKTSKLEHRKISMHSSSTNSTSTNLRDLASAHSSRFPASIIQLNNDSMHSHCTNDSGSLTTTHLSTQNSTSGRQNTYSSFCRNPEDLNSNITHRKTSDFVPSLASNTGTGLSRPLQSCPSESNIRTNAQIRTAPIRSYSEHQSRSSTTIDTAATTTASSTVTLPTNTSLITPTHSRSRIIRRPPARNTSSSMNSTTLSSNSESSFVRDVSDDYASVYTGGSSRSFEVSSHGSSMRSIFSHVGESMRSIMEECKVPESSQLPLSAHESNEVSMDGVEILIKDMMQGQSYEAVLDLLVTTMTMEKDSKNTQIMCIQTVVDVFNKNEVSIEAVIDSNIHVCLLSVMKKFKSTVEIQNWACQALVYLSASDIARRQLYEAGVVQVIQTTLSAHIGDVGVVQNTISALRSLSLESCIRETLRQVSLSEKQIVQAMLCHPMHIGIQRDGCAVLSNVSIENESSDPQEVSIEVLEVIVNTLQTHIKNTTVIDSACFALKNLSFNSVNAHRMLELENTLAVFQQLEQSNDDAADVLEALTLIQIEKQSMEEYALVQLQSIEDGGDPNEALKAIIKVLGTCKTSIRVVKTALMLLCTRFVNEDVVGHSLEVDAVNDLVAITSHCSYDADTRQYISEVLSRFQQVSTANCVTKSSLDDNSKSDTNAAQIVDVADS